jgi:hypothetical protein
MDDTPLSLAIADCRFSILFDGLLLTATDAIHPRQSKIQNPKSKMPSLTLAPR